MNLPVGASLASCGERLGDSSVAKPGLPADALAIVGRALGIVEDYVAAIPPATWEHLDTMWGIIASAESSSSADGIPKGAT